jgi:hypothetical protein
MGCNYVQLLSTVSHLLYMFPTIPSVFPRACVAFAVDHCRTATYLRSISLVQKSYTHYRYVCFLPNVSLFGSCFPFSPPLPNMFMVHCIIKNWLPYYVIHLATKYGLCLKKHVLIDFTVALIIAATVLWNCPPIMPFTWISCINMTTEIILISFHII